MIHHGREVFALMVLAATAATVSAKEIDQHWTLTLSAISDFEAAISLVQASPDTIPDEYASKEVHPTLEFRCSARGDGTVTVQIDWRRFISSFNTEVGFRVDDGKAIWMKMGVDSSNRITVAKSASESAKLIEEISGATSLKVEVAPYSEPSVFVNFDVSTFAAALDQLRGACT